MSDFNEEIEKIKRALSEVPRLKYADISLAIEGICYTLDALKLPTCEMCRYDDTCNGRVFPECDGHTAKMLTGCIGGYEPKEPKT